MTSEIYIFGSATRGEVSPTSDIDILVIPDTQKESDYPPGWSVYSRDTIEFYFEQGRLFAWHLHLDAVRIFPQCGSSYLQSLGSPTTYSTAFEDISNLEKILHSSLRELRANTKSVIFELGLVYTVIRDIAMSASWSELGHPNFSAYVPFVLLRPPPLLFETYHGMMLARHSSSRGTPYPPNFKRLRDELLYADVLGWANAIRSSV